MLQAGVRLKLSKGSFGVRRAVILDHAMEKDRIRPSGKQNEAISKLVEPKSRDDLMRFFGLVKIFVDFMDHFAHKTASLHEMLQVTEFTKRRRHGEILLISDCNNRWLAAQEKALSDLKLALTDLKVLESLIRGVPRRIMTEVGLYVFDGVLLQSDGNGQWIPISCSTRIMRNSEGNYMP